jgi:hypothetical protein
LGGVAGAGRSPPRPRRRSCGMLRVASVLPKPPGRGARNRAGSGELIPSVRSSPEDGRPDVVDSHPGGWRCRTRERLGAELGVSRPVGAVLARRGLADVDEARRFLAADERHDPLPLPGIPQARELILDHLRRGSRIAVFGDSRTPAQDAWMVATIWWYGRSKPIAAAGRMKQRGRQRRRAGARRPRRPQGCAGSAAAGAARGPRAGSAPRASGRGARATTGPLLSLHPP